MLLVSWSEPKLCDVGIRGPIFLLSSLLHCQGAYDYWPLLKEYNPLAASLQSNLL